MAANTETTANTGSTAKPLAQADKVRKPHASTAATRERILTAAMSVFANRGYNNGSLLEIADQVGMTHAGVLHYFGSKDNLLTAVLERCTVVGPEGSPTFRSYDRRVRRQWAEARGALVLGT